MSPAVLLARLFFKRRTVLALGADAPRPPVGRHDLFDVAVLAAPPAPGEAPPALAEAAAAVGAGRLAARLADGRCVLYLAVERGTGRLGGYYWAAVPRSEAVWHDRFRVAAGEALLFNAFVPPSQRRRGVYSLLIRAAHEHLFAVLGVRRAFTVVEDLNRASMAANLGCGLAPAGRNVLVKALGVNLVALQEGVEPRAAIVAALPGNGRAHRF